MPPCASVRVCRFPCCGKAYPCDICHDDAEKDHEMKYANRMICGFCAREQVLAVMLVLAAAAAAVDSRLVSTLRLCLLAVTCK